MYFSLVRPLQNLHWCALLWSSLVIKASSSTLNSSNCVRAFFYVVTTQSSQYWNSASKNLATWKCDVSKSFEISELHRLDTLFICWPIETLNLKCRSLCICVGLNSFCEYIPWVFNFHEGLNDIHVHMNIFECCVIFTNATHANGAKIYIQNNIKMYWNMCYVRTCWKLKYISHFHALDIGKSHE